MRRNLLRYLTVLVFLLTIIRTSFPTGHGQTRTTQPMIFAPGIISSDLDESGGAFSPDGNDFYFTLIAPYTTAPRFAMICVSHLRNGHWQTPQTVPFSGTFFDIAPHPSPDGNVLYFASIRPTSQSKVRRFRIWVTRRSGDHWSDPTPLASPINTDDSDSLDPAIAADGSLYFASQRQDPAGHFHIFFAHWDGTKFLESEKLGPEINSEFMETAPAISPDGSTLVFASSAAPEDADMRRKEDMIASGKPYPRQDLYVSVRRNGRWTPARHLGHGVNSFAEEVYPSFSPDGKFLYWGSERSAFDIPTKRLNSAQIDSLWRTNLNGRGNIYFISADVLTDSEGTQP